MQNFLNGKLLDSCQVFTKPLIKESITFIVHYLLLSLLLNALRSYIYTITCVLITGLSILLMYV